MSFGLPTPPHDYLLMVDARVRAPEKYWHIVITTTSQKLLEQYYRVKMDDCPF